MKYALGYIGLATALLTGCNNSSTPPPPPQVVTPHPPTVTPQPPVVDNSVPTELRGIWQAPGYGEVMEITANTVSTYLYTSDFCVLNLVLENVTAEAIQTRLRTEGQGIIDFGSYGTAEHHAPGKRYHAANALPESCNTNLIARIQEDNYIVNPERDAAFFAQIFDEYYLDFNQHNVDWSAVTQALLANVSPQTTDSELFDLFETALDDINDGHVSIEFQDNDVSKETKPSIQSRLLQEYFTVNNLQPPFTTEQLTAAALYIDESLAQFPVILAQYLPQNTEFNVEANNNIVWFQMGDIGYIAILGMGIYSNDGELASEIAITDEVMDRILTTMQDTQGLILDVRLNGGGFDFVSTALAGHFTDTPFTGYSKQVREGSDRSPLVNSVIHPRGETYTKPIMLLTSSSTASAAEVFTIAMRELPHVTVLGEATQGALSDILSVTLPNGIELGLSNEFYLSPNGEWFEGSGVPVDAFVPFFTLEQRNNTTDLGIDTAIQRLQKLAL